MTKHYFTFGTNHITNYPLPKAGRLADFWVEVAAPSNSDMTHRDLFIFAFAEHHLPRPEQWAFEYTETELKPEYFPGGPLCIITSDGAIGMVNPELPTFTPFETVSRIGVKTYVIAQSSKGRLIGYFEFDNGDISSAHWDRAGHFGMIGSNCNDIMIDGKFWDSE